MKKQLNEHGWGRFDEHCTGKERDQGRTYEKEYGRFEESDRA